MNQAYVFDNKMWIAGGADASDRMNDVWYSANGISWTQATTNAQWSGRYATYGLAVFNNQMWIIGGTNWITAWNDIWYSSNGISWTQATTYAQWHSRGWHVITTFDNKMWVTGGYYNPNMYNDVWYSANGISWTQATAYGHFSARQLSTLFAYNNRIWIIGGADNDTNQNDVWYSSNGVSWTKANNANWPARQYTSSLVYNNKIWILGGYDDYVLGVQFNDVWYSGTGDVTIEEKSATPTSTVFWYNGMEWESGSTSETTDTGANGKNPQYPYAGAIRVREYEQTSATTTYFYYNLKIATQPTFGEYDYYTDFGGKYLTSSSNSGSGHDETISSSWLRSSSATMNSPYTCTEGSAEECLNNAPTNGSWYVGMFNGLTFSIDNYTINFGTITPGAAPVDATNVLTVSTSATNGYVITAWSTQTMLCSYSDECGSEDIDDWGGTNESPSTWDSGVYGFGYSTDDTALLTGTADRFSGPKFAGFTHTGAGDVVADRSSSECPCSGQMNTITYRVAANYDQRAGDYETTIVYVATANY